MDIAHVKNNAAQSGMCGKNLRWYRLGAELYIEGTGILDMYWEEWYEETDGMPYGIERIVIGYGCTEIGGSAFGRGSESPCENWCNLTHIEIPESVKVIGACAFETCDELQEIHIPSSVVTIEENAFEECDSLRSLEIPESVTEIGAAAFLECRNLVQINVAANNPKYTSVDGVLFDKQMHTLISFPTGKTGKYTIPYGVRRIADSAFHGSRLTEIQIPDSVKQIDRVAFGNYYLCGGPGLSEIKIPDSVTEIAWNAFSRVKHIEYYGVAESKNHWGAHSRN